MRCLHALLASAILFAPPPCAGEEAAVPPRPQAAGAGAPEEPWDERRVARLAAALEDERFALREQAGRELAGAPASAFPLLLRAARISGAAEARLSLYEASRTLFLSQVVRELDEWKVGRGFIGIRWTVSSDPPGVTVSSVLPGTGAARAGLKQGDLIAGVGAQEFKAGFAQQEALDVWKGLTPGASIVLRVRRAGLAPAVGPETPVPLEDVRVTLSERPPEYSNPQADEQKAAELWVRCRTGALALPERLTRPRPAPPAGPVQSARPPLQSWPPEWEARDENGDE